MTYLFNGRESLCDLCDHIQWRLGSYGADTAGFVVGLAFLSVRLFVVLLAPELALGLMLQLSGRGTCIQVRVVVCGCD